MEGKKDDIKGRVKEAAGDLTDDDDLKREGKTDRGFRLGEGQARAGEGQGRGVRRQGEGPAPAQVADRAVRGFVTAPGDLRA